MNNVITITNVAIKLDSGPKEPPAIIDGFTISKCRRDGA